MKLRVGAWVFVAVLISGMALAGPKWEYGEDAWAKLSLLGQVHYTYSDDAEEDADFFLRRGRVILAGQVADGVRLFVETDNDKAGKRGTSVSTDIQDAFIDLRVARFECPLFGESEHWAQAGLILLPFSFENRSSAATLLGLDYNAAAVKLPNTFVWRDYGAELYGHLGRKLGYTIGVFDGYDEEDNIKNPEAQLRFTGHMAVNLVGDYEQTWFFTQDRRGEQTYVSVGAGIDIQDEATLTYLEPAACEGIAVQADGAGQGCPAGSTCLLVSCPPPAPVVADSENWVVDMQSGARCGEVDLVLNAAYYDWDNILFAGNTAFVEGGVGMGQVMATGKYSLQDPEGSCNTEDFTGGLHYFLKDHQARAGVELRWGDSDQLWLLGLQILL